MVWVIWSLWKKLFQNPPYSFNPLISKKKKIKKKALSLLDTCMCPLGVRNDLDVCISIVTAVLLMNALGVSRYCGHKLCALEPKAI